jgi:hypothetical protein
MHSHFGNCTRVGVANVHNLGWKGKQTPNGAPMTPLERLLKLICLNLICMNYDQKNGRESNEVQLERAIHC